MSLWENGLGISAEVAQKFCFCKGSALVELFEDVRKFILVKSLRS